MWSDDLTDEETDVLIDKAASEIARRGMQVPAILALEMNKPLASVGANLSLVFAPFVVPFFGFDFVNDYGRPFQKRDNVEKLLQRIEQTTKKPAAKD